jgi:hypothetical protein
MVDDSPPRRLRRDALVQCFAATLGLEKSGDVVLASARKLGLPNGDDLRLDQALAIVDDLATVGGLVGVVARFVKTRGDLRTLAEARPNVTSPLLPRVTSLSAPQAGQAAARVEESQVATSEIIDHFATAMGEARAREVVATHAASTGAAGAWLSRAQVMALLEAMASEEGIVGVTARFAKAKFILKLRAT